MNDPARQFIVSPNGSIEFGFIDPETAGKIGVAPGPVRLQHGYPGNSGFGNAHVESYPDRVKQLASLDFASFRDFAYRVAQRYTKVGEGKLQRLLLIERYLGHDLQLIVEHQNAESYWTIVSGLPYRVARCKMLCEVTRSGSSEPTPNVAERPRFATLSLPKKIASGGNGS